MDADPPAQVLRLSPEPRVRIGGVDVDPIGAVDAALLIVMASGRSQGGTVVTPNIHHLHEIRRQHALRRCYQHASLILVDGMPLVWAARIQGTPVPERVAGSDLIWHLARAAARRAPLYVLGGREGAAEGAARQMQEAAPGLEIAGTSCPPVGFEGQSDLWEREVEQLEAAEPGIVLVALGAPKQEQVSLELHRRFPHMWFVSVGAGVDMAAGVVSRAPSHLQGAGLEWTYRLAQEPRRLAHRYLVTGVPTAGRLLAGSALVRARGEVSSRSASRR